MFVFAVLCMAFAASCYYFWLYHESRKRVEAWFKQNGYELFGLELSFRIFDTPFKLAPYSSARIYRAIVARDGEKQKFWVKCGVNVTRKLDELFEITVIEEGYGKKN